MNRQQRRQAARQHPGTRAAHAFARAYHCADCTADTALIETAPGVFVLRVFHDETCPSYRAMNGSTP